MIYRYFNKELALCASPLLFKRGVETAIAIGIGSAIAGVASSAMTSDSNEAIAENTNEQNKKSVADTNETNLQIARETNESNEAMQREVNATNIQLQREMNVYNSIGSQIERGRSAGVNPNSILGGSVSGNVQTTLPNVKASQAIAPIMQAFQAMNYAKANPTEQMADLFSKIGPAIADIKNTYSDTNQKNLLGDYQKVVNKYVDEMQKLGIKVNQAQINDYVAKASESWQNLRNAKIDGEKIRAMIEGLNLDNYDKCMRNVFSRDFYETAVKQAQSICNVNETTARLMVARFPYDIGLIKSQTSSNYASAHYMKEMASLAPEMRRVLQEQADFLNSQTFSNWLDNNFKQDMTDEFKSIVRSQESEGRAKAKREWQGYSKDVWENSDIMRFSTWFGQMVGSVSQGVGAYVGARFGSKGLGAGSMQGSLPSPSSYSIPQGASVSNHGWFSNGY